MSARIRGREATISLVEDGQTIEGSMVKVSDFTATPRAEINEKGYLGEKEDDLDIIHKGWDFSFSIDLEDNKALLVYQNIVSREENNQPHPRYNLVARMNFRKPGAGAAVITYRNSFLKLDEEGFSGRNEYITNKFSGKCKRRSVSTA